MQRFLEIIGIIAPVLLVLYALERRRKKRPTQPSRDLDHQVVKSDYLDNLHDPSTVEGHLFQENMSPPNESGAINNDVEWR